MKAIGIDIGTTSICVVGYDMVSGAIGDNQASVYAAAFEDERLVSINVGTGSDHIRKMDICTCRHL